MSESDNSEEISPLDAEQLEYEKQLAEFKDRAKKNIATLLFRNMIQKVAIKHRRIAENNLKALIAMDEKRLAQKANKAKAEPIPHASSIACFDCGQLVYSSRIALHMNKCQNQMPTRPRPQYKESPVERITIFKKKKAKKKKKVEQQVSEKEDWIPDCEPSTSQEHK